MTTRYRHPPHTPPTCYSSKIVEMQDERRRIWPLIKDNIRSAQRHSKHSTQLLISVYHSRCRRCTIGGRSGGLLLFFCCCFGQQLNSSENGILGFRRHGQDLHRHGGRWLLYTQMFRKCDLSADWMETALPVAMRNASRWLPCSHSWTSQVLQGRRASFSTSRNNPRIRGDPLSPWLRRANCSVPPDNRPLNRFFVGSKEMSRHSAPLLKENVTIKRPIKFEACDFSLRAEGRRPPDNKFVTRREYKWNRIPATSDFSRA